MHRRCFLSALTMLALVACAPPGSPPAAGAAPASTREAAIAVPERHAADVAESILNSGGNAVDAAVATGFVLAVTFPEAGNIGGGGFMLLHMNGEPAFLDYRETAPQAAHRDMYLDESGEVIENASLIGVRSAGVPGTVAGLWEAHRRFGSIPWRDLVMPAVRLAREGYVLPRELASEIDEYRQWFADTNFDDYFGGLETGQSFKQPELARTLQRIADAGGEDFYRGETARLIVDYMQRRGGLITLQDLQRYETKWRSPLRARWRAYDVISSPPPSSGGFGVIQLLKMKQALAAEFDGLGHNSAQYVHLVAEMEKRVFADRAEYFGDPDFVEVPIDELLQSAYITRRAQEVNPRHISAAAAAQPGLESPDTTHFSILDGDGNAVSNTYTLNWSFGSGAVVEGAGFLLNDQMDDFSVKPGVPNIYGVVGNKANEIQPGKRMLSSMAPTIMLRDGQVSTILGTTGGSTIMTTVFQGIVNMVDFGMTPQDAAAASRFHHQLLPPDLITFSPSRPLPDDVITELSARGYTLRPHDWEYGDLQLIHHDGDALLAGSDPRGRGRSRVFEIVRQEAATPDTAAVIRPD